MSQKRKSSPGNRQNEENAFWWFVLVVLVCVGIWFWWSRRGSDEPKSPAERLILKPVVRTVQTNTVATNANMAGITNTNPPSLTAPVLQPVTPLAPVLVQTSALMVVQTSAPPVEPVPSRGFPRPPRDTFEAQIALSRFAISPGSIDGAIGSQTRAAFAAFQARRRIPTTGELDPATRAELALVEAPLQSYTITTNDLLRLQPLSTSWLGKSRQSALDYENIVELLAERGHASPNLVRRLNPGVNWSNVVAGTEVSIPKADYPQAPAKAAFIVISLAKKQLQAFDSATNLLAHFPCSIAARYDKRPLGELRVITAVANPDYTFNPKLFPESSEAKRLSGKLILPPGPNNPVGTAWVGLDRPGYGIHGTPIPEQVGRTESHGCFRLANWNASYLVKIVSIGLPVRVIP